MSQLITNFQVSPRWLITRDDPIYRLDPPEFRMGVAFAVSGQLYDLLPRGDYLWYGSMKLGQAAAGIGGMMTEAWQEDWFFEVRYSGVKARKLISGVTKDASGVPLGGCTVDLFRTSTNEMVDSVVSDAAGNYKAGSPYEGAHYCVAYKTGSPDVFGTSKNTLGGT